MKKSILSLGALTVLILTVSMIFSSISFYCADEVTLPEGYTKLEYVESDGTQYFNTEYYPNSGSKIVVDFELTGVKEDVTAIFGSMTAPITMLAIGSTSPNKVQTNFGGGYYPNFYATFYQVRTTYIVDAPNLYGQVGDAIHEYSVSTPNIDDSDYPLYILARSRDDGEPTNLATGKLYGAQIYQYGELVRNYVPCKTSSDIYGLYDTVNGDFCPSSGGSVYSDTSSVTLVYEDNFSDGKEDSTVKVSSVAVSGSRYLFLPSYVDFKSVKFSGIETGTVLSDVTGKSIIFTEGEAVDLTDIFGEMTAGTYYTLVITTSKGTVDESTSRVKICKSSSVSSIFVTLGKGHLYRNDVDSITLDQINGDSNKTSYASSGTVTKISPAGECSVVAELKKFSGRGNTSWYTSSKKPYNINLKTKEKMLEGEAAAKKWAVIANNVSDETGLANMSAYTLFQLLDGDGAIHFEAVDLYIDGEYRGAYMLVQRITDGQCGIDSASDIDTEKVSAKTKIVVKAGGLTGESAPKDWPGYASSTWTDAEKEILKYGIQAFKYSNQSTNVSDGGYILEYDFRFSSEPCWFVTRRGIQVAIKTPEYVSIEQMKAIACKVQDFEDALYSDTGYNSKGEHYSDVLDLDSLAKRYLLDCFTLQVDMMSSSSYMFIDGDENGLKGKLMTGPAWDYDAEDLTGPNAGNLYKYSTWRNRGCRIWIEQLLKKGDFVSILREKNASLIEYATEIAYGSAEKYGTLSYFEELISDSFKMSGKRWSKNTQEYELLPYAYIRDFKNRLTAWIKLWSDETNNLRGVTVSQSEKTLVADAVGAATYQWYRLSDDKRQLTAISGANGAEYSPAEAGWYIVKITGKPLGKTADNADAGSVMYSAAYKFISQSGNISGDLNGDGKIKGNDATLLLKYLADWKVTIVTESADINGDGNIKGNDATLLLKYLADWDVKLGK